MAISILFISMAILGVGVMVVTKNVVHAAYALALVLVSLAGVYVLLNAELLAVVQILLYAGGVVILLLFGVMMTNRLRGEKLLSESKNVVISAIISVTVFVFLCLLFSKVGIKVSEAPAADQIKSIGVLFLTDHLVAFELIAFILLVALVGSAYLAKMSADE